VKFVLVAFGASATEKPQSRGKVAGSAEARRLDAGASAMTRVMKIVIEYEMDDGDATEESERQDWLDGNVNVADVIATDGFVSFQVVEG